MRVPSLSATLAPEHVPRHVYTLFSLDVRSAVDILGKLIYSLHPAWKASGVHNNRYSHLVNCNARAVNNLTVTHDRLRFKTPSAEGNEMRAQILKKYVVVPIPYNALKIDSEN